MGDPGDQGRLGLESAVLVIGAPEDLDAEDAPPGTVPVFAARRCRAGAEAAGLAEA